MIVILLDNLGFGATKPFGGVINMPTLERLAKDGCDLHQFSYCAAVFAQPHGASHRPQSAQRQHGIHLGVSHSVSGPNLRASQQQGPLPEILKLNGYSTAMFGKSHEFTPWETGLTGPFDQWPTGAGFERFYGTLSGEADMFAPPLHDNSTLVDLPNDPNYYYQTDLADHAISWIRSQKVTDSRQAVLHLLRCAGHALTEPGTEASGATSTRASSTRAGTNTARKSWRGRRRLGIVPPNTQLTPKPDEMQDWDKLSADEKKVFTRHQEIFAAYAEMTDYEIGRVVQAIEDLGVMDNTLIIYVTGDNGSSANGGPDGRFNTFYSFNQIPETLEDQFKHLDEFGGPHSDMTPPLGWAIADNTPFAYAQGEHILRRHYQRRGHSLAEGYQGEGRNSPAVPSSH